ncbi:MAG: hypothetical protein M3P45_12995 [Acidobacteriota bacterium]|nr:hypothetical protein [Acidobacteriota bacterium]
MRTVTARHLLLCSIAFVLCAHALPAQAPLEPSQMPANTAFYFVWRGQPSAELRKSNSIAALWDDPGFAPVRSSITNALLKNAEEKSSEPRLTRQQLDEYASLLENPFVLGYLSDPRKQNGFVVSANPSPGKTTPWNGIFFVYDRTGKEAILSRAVLSLRANEKDVPQISQVAIAGIPALKVQRKSSTTYWVEHDKYAISASETAVLEEILNRLGGKSVSSGTLADSAAYKEAQAVLGKGQLEFFLRVPDLKNFASDSSAGGFRMSPVLDAMKLDAIHCLAGRVLMKGAQTRVQAAALGDPAAGTLFDIWDEGAAAPPAMKYVPADAVSYTDTEINLNALYELIKRIAAAVMPPGRQGSVDMLDMMAQAKLGQSLSSALALFTGEFASLQNSASLDKNKQIYLVGVRDKAGALKLLHTLLGERISSERSEKETTFMKISTGGGQGAAGTAQWDFYHVAATPDYFVIAPRLETVRAFLAGRSHSPTTGLSAAPGFQVARAQFPATINGLGYFDFHKVDWPALKARIVAQVNAAPGTKRKPGAAKADAPVTPSWLLDLNPEVFAHHLHVATSASWKDAQGLHFDEWIQ